VPEGIGMLDWDRITEHVARAERVSLVIREQGLEVASLRFAGSNVAIEAAALAAAAHQEGSLTLDQVIGVLRCTIDHYVFYAPFLELLVELGRSDLDRALEVYEEFVTAYAAALVDAQHGNQRIGTVRDGLADVYVSVGRLDDAEALFARRHEEDQNDVAVALSASRAFYAAGSVSRAVRWLGVAAARAAGLGRNDLAARLRGKQANLRKRLS
jgi:tetratricopeptide (TPR) repeat protein